MNITKANTFVRTYLDNNRSIAQTASKLGVKPAAVRSRIKAYQKRGVKLPPPTDLPTNSLQVKALNELIRNYKG